jgi:hypothetical protein
MLDSPAFSMAAHGVCYCSFPRKPNYKKGDLKVLMNRKCGNGYRDRQPLRQGIIWQYLLSMESK